MNWAPPERLWPLLGVVAPAVAYVLAQRRRRLTAAKDATLEGGGSIGIGFAVPIERAGQVATSLIARG
jgi:S1-C subfamily serine protease